MTKVVIVATSAGDLQGHPTGLWIEELAAPYYKFKDAGYDIVLASPAGGAIPIDQNSLGEGFFTDAAKKFMHDGEAVGALCHSVKLATVDVSSGVDAIFMCGGHGTCVDFVSDESLKSAIESMFNAGKIVSGVCHGVNSLAACKKSDGSPLVQGLAVTGFTDSEEEVVQLTGKVPFLIEAKFKELGAKYEKADNWHPKVCVDGKLVTGQNPQSSDEVAEAVIKLLSA